MRNFTLNKQSFVQGAISFLEKFDMSGKPKGERLENICAKELMEDRDVAFAVEALKSKIGIPGEYAVVPVFDDKTLLISKYVLALDGNIVLQAPDYYKLQSAVTALVLEQDNAKVADFVTQVKFVLQSAR